MIFKTDRIKEEWALLRSGAQTAPSAPLVVAVALYVDDVSQRVAGRQAVVTGIWRSPAEQAQYGVKGARSVHEFWRGVDFRSTIYSADQVDEICAEVNGVFRYSDKLVVLALHNKGTAPHLHGQVPVGRQWRI